MMQKNPQTRVDVLWIFTDFHRVLWVQSPSCTPAREFQQWHLAANREIVYEISENFPLPPPSPSAPTILTPPTFRDPRVPKYFEQYNSLYFIRCKRYH